MGGNNTIEGNLRDVWRWETAGAYEQHPSHTYTEPGIYSVALQAYHSDGYASASKTAYITVNPPVPDVTIAPAGDDVVLEWPPVTEDVNGNPITVSHYEVWRSLSPYCVPGDTACPEPMADDDPTDTLFVDVEAAVTATPYFYKVLAVDAEGVTLASSNETGKFGFTLAPGQPDAEASVIAQLQTCVAVGDPIPN